MPSWVPDWSCQQRKVYSFRPYYRPNHRAVGDPEILLEASIEERRLKVQGFIADRVWFLGPTLGEETRESITDEDLEAAPAILADLVHAPDENNRIWSLREGVKTNRLDQMKETLRSVWYPKWIQWISIIVYFNGIEHLRTNDHADLMPTPHTGGNDGPSSLSNREGHPISSIGPAQDSEDQEGTSTGELEAIFTEAMDPEFFKPKNHQQAHFQDLRYFILENRRLCITRAGRLSIVPADANKQDEILTFSGASTPFIIRKTDDGHILVGDCFIRGLMQGEGLESVQSTLVSLS
ncbi:MAG: hypothetical protein M1820_009892 [Bogoriella megaspora]|nr:MAG: hypothetical protein M1820_009892 [Bogoriella megaspora]